MWIKNPANLGPFREIPAPKECTYAKSHVEACLSRSPAGSPPRFSLWPKHLRLDLRIGHRYFGGRITDANVTLTNLGTAEKRTQSSGSDGLFTFVNLFPGQYRIDVEKQGFKHFVRTDITVQVQQDTHINAALQVGEVSQVVEVTAETPLLQTESSSLGQVVEQRKADELPLNGRNIFNLITILLPPSRRAAPAERQWARTHSAGATIRSAVRSPIRVQSIWMVNP
jgi:hypothetical protein